MSERIKLLKARARLEHVAEGYVNLTQVGSSLKATCPHHEDKTPSLDICVKRQTYKCFSCGVQGDVVDFIEMMEKVDTKEAIRALSCYARGKAYLGPKKEIKDENNIENKPKAVISSPSIAPLIIPSIKPLKVKVPIKQVPNSKSPKPISIEKTFKQIITHYQNQLGKDKQAQEYLKSRGLFNPEIINTFGIGFCTGGIKRLLPQNEDLLSSLQEKGLFNANLNESFYTCLTFPLYNQQNEPVGMYGRGIHNSAHKYLKGGHKGVFNWQALKVYREIIITESIIDALSLYVLGFKNVIPLYGTNGLSSAHVEVLKQYNPEKIIFLLDNDEAAAQSLLPKGEIIQKLKPLDIPLFKADLPKSINDKPCKDINDFLINKGTNLEIKKIVEASVSLLPSKKAGQLTEKMKEGELIPTNENEALYCAPSTKCTYTLKGLQTIGKQSMRLVIGIKHQGNYHTDRIDLYSFKARKSFARVVEKDLGLNIIHCEKDLLDLLSALETYIETIDQQATETTTPDKILTDREKQEAKILLQNPSLLQKISDDLTQTGYAGETKNKKLTYLVATSRKLDSPLSCMIRSQSGAGKSQLMEKVASFIPEEDLLLFSRISTQSLFYMPKDALVHKLVIIDERNGSEASEYAIRTLQSQHKLTQAVVMKDPSTGKQRTQMFEIFGPIAYMDSSTQTEINPENENRCFVIFLGENQDQTNLVLSAQRKSRMVSGWQQKQNKEALQTLHKNAQRMLRPLKVIIPYADKITFPDKWVRVRRDQERFLSLIEASAFLHQYQRPIKSCELGEYIEATIDDYAIAYDLSRDILQSSLSDLSKMASNVYHTIKTNIEAMALDEKLSVERVSFTQKDVRGWTSLSLQIVKRAMKELFQLEYINGSSNGSGSRFKYSLGSDAVLPSLKGLLSPDDLSKKL